MPASELCNRTGFTTAGGECLKLCPDASNSKITEDLVQELACDLEEADTHLLLHVSCASYEFSTDIETPDTDVVLLSRSFQHELPV